MLNLSNVTLFGLDTVNYPGLVRAAEISQQWIKFGSVVLLSDKDVLISSGEGYSRFILGTLPAFVKTDYVLIIQADGYVLNPEAWDADYLNYDYIGAPWPYTFRDVGNGGFSLRSQKFIKTITNIYHEDLNAEFHPEDNYACRLKYDAMIEAGIKFAPATLAKKFSMEANWKYGNKWSGQFGFHNNKITDLSEYEPTI